MKGKNPKLFGTYGKPDRDPRGHCISVVYEVELQSDNNCDNHNLDQILSASSDAAKAEFIDINSISQDKMAFDHYDIINEYINKRL